MMTAITSLPQQKTADLSAFSSSSSNTLVAWSNSEEWAITSQVYRRVHSVVFRNAHINQYVFCGDNPVMCKDPSGLDNLWGNTGQNNPYGSFPLGSFVGMLSNAELQQRAVARFGKAPPSGIDFQANILEASGMDTIVWFAAVRPGPGIGKWNYRKVYGGESGDECPTHSRDDLTNLGNYNYGATGAAQGFSRPMLDFIGGAAQTVGGKRAKDADYPWHKDNPKDAVWASQGYLDYQNGYWFLPITLDQIQ